MDRHGLDFGLGLGRGAGVSSAGEPIEYWLNNAVYDAVSDSTLPITEEL